MPEASHTAPDGTPVSLRGRVEQANKVLTDVVDTSFGMLRALLPTANPNPNTSNAAAATAKSEPGAQVPVEVNQVKPGFGLLRRESGLLIKNITAVLPMSRGTKSGEEVGQQLLAVSKPESIKSGRGEDSGVEESEDDGSEDEDEEDEEDANESASGFGDARSIRSFESMLSEKGSIKKKTKNSGGGTRRSLSDRLAHMSNLAGFKVCLLVFWLTPLSISDCFSKGSPPTSRPSVLPHSAVVTDFPRLAPPIQRFVECTPGDLRLSEVEELLRDYQRLVEGIRAVGGFES